MLGIDDFWVGLGYLLCLLSTLLCIAYGLLARRRADDDKPTGDDAAWARDEDRGADRG